MAKSRKSSANPSQPAVRSAGRQPLQGIEKVAWWSVPAVGVVALACAATIGVLMWNKPATVASVSAPVLESKVEQPGIVTPESKPQITPTSRETESKAEPIPESDVEATADETEQGQKLGDPIPFAKADPEPKSVTDTPAPKTVTPVSVAAKTVMALTCSEGRISFEGKQDLTFVEKQPALELIEDGNVKFAHLVFDGVDQSAELSPISRAQGSIEIVTLMPDRETSVILDTNFQRMTLRKNRDGLRWRIGGKKKPDKIRLIGTPVNFDQWHHVMMTWKAGENAILYVDGVEQDRYPYVFEQPHFAEFEKVVLGRTRGPGGRYYKSRVNKLVVYDQPIAPEKVAELNQAVRQTYPNIFQ